MSDMGCDSCEFVSSREARYKCLSCNFRMCFYCYMKRLVRNPGHTLRPITKAEHGSSPTSVTVTEPSWENNTTGLGEDSSNETKRPCCSTCFNYTPDFVQGDQSISTNWVWRSHHKPALSKFQESAANGCELCSVVYRGVSKAFPYAPRDDSKISLSISGQMLTVAVVRVEAKGTYGDDSLDFINIRARAGYPRKWSTLESTEKLSNHLGDARCFDTIKKWLNTCEKSHEHPRCRQRAETTLPRRLVSITRTPRGPRLKLDEFSGTKGKYMALSHCWGGFVGCQTTTANIAERTNRIDYNTLPRTFKDALYCAWRLEIPYLWIDSLCIVQDDTADWERETSKMCDIYSDAYLVLAATSASADNKGFFAGPGPHSRGIDLESESRSGVFDMVMRRIIPHSVFSDHAVPFSSVSFGPLEDRAWTLQEILLARRCVGFNFHEIAWECQSAIDCECGETVKEQVNRATKGHDAPIYGPTWTCRVITSFTEGASYKITRPRPLSRLDDLSALHTDWRLLILPNYMRRALTFPSDKLPALSGIAGIIGRSSGDKYLAGIWLKDMSYGLAWQILQEVFPEPAQVTPLGPTFSWVSVDDRITYRTPCPTRTDGSAVYGSVTVTVLDYSIQLATQDPYGSVRSGWIKISALTHTLGLSRSDYDYELVSPSPHQPHTMEFHPNTPLRGFTVYGTKSEFVCVQRAIRREDNQFSALVPAVLLFDMYSPDGLAYDDRLYYKGARSGRFAPVEVALMVLSPSPSANGRFQRIGLATVQFELEVAYQWIRSAKKKVFVIE